MEAVTLVRTVSERLGIPEDVLVEESLISFYRPGNAH